MALFPLADRRRRRPCLALAVIALAAVGFLALGGCSKDEAALSAGISASASLSPSTAAIGVPVRYEVRVEYSKGMDVEIEDVASSLEGFEINDRGQTARRSLLGGRVVKSRRYDITTYSVGDHVVPWPGIRYADKAAPDASPEVLPGAPLVLSVYSVLDESAVDVRDIKLPVNLPAKRIYWLLAGAAMAMLLAAAATFFLLRKTKSRIDIVLPAPHEIAYAELDRLAGMSPANWEEIREFYYRLSLCVRIYIESRFGVHAPHQTTQEFLFSVASSDEILGAQGKLLRHFLYHCDVVKFAKYYPTSSEIAQSLAVARRFVDRTRTLPEETASIEVNT